MCFVVFDAGGGIFLLFLNLAGVHIVFMYCTYIHVDMLMWAVYVCTGVK